MMKTNNKAQIRDALEIFHEALSKRTAYLEIEMLNDSSNYYRSVFREPRHKDLNDLLKLFKALFHDQLIKPDRKEP